MVVQQVESLAEKGQASGQLRMSRYLIDCYLEALQNESAPTVFFVFCFFLSLHCLAHGPKS